MESASILKNIFGRSVPAPVTGIETIKTWRHYRCFRDEIPESLKIYLDYMGQRFVPIVVNDTKWFVSEDYLGEVCAELLDGRCPLKCQYVEKPNPVVRFQEFYIGEIPRYLQILFSLHDIRFETFEQNRYTYRVWEGRYEQVCKKICDGNRRQSQPVSETILQPLEKVNIADFYRDDDNWELTSAYLTLIGVQFVQVVHHQQKYHIPLSHMDLATRRLNLYA